MNTVVELPEFIRRAKKLLRDAERERVIYSLAANPTAGVLLEGTGGIRKLRWKREARGKVEEFASSIIITISSIHCFS